MEGYDNHENHEHLDAEEVEEHFASIGNLMDSKTSHLDDVLNEKLARAFHQQTSQVLLHDVAKIASEHDPIDLAYAVSRLPAKARIVVYENLPDLQAKIIFMINTGSHTRAIIFRQISNNEIVELLENMPTDEAVSMMEDMSDRRMARVLHLTEPKKRQRILDLHQHDRNSAGRLMNNEFFAFHMNTTIGEVSSHIRDNPGIDLTRNIFVLSEGGELAGFVPTRNLIVNPAFLPLRQVMRPILHTVKPDTSRDEVVDVVERYEVGSLPVVDDENRLVGVIAYEDVVEAMEDIADETIASIAGTAEDVSEHEPILKRFFWRAPWLIVTFCAGLVTSTTMTFFSDRPWLAFAPFFVPLIAGMSGNVGLQCSTMLVRGMATGELSQGMKGEAIMKELGIGMLIGLTFGILCASLIFLLNQMGFHHADWDPSIVGVTVSCGLLGACLTATMLGTFSPFFFARVGIDPAVASGPIVTAFNDVSSTLMFILIARMVYGIFLLW